MGCGKCWRQCRVAAYIPSRIRSAAKLRQSRSSSYSATTPTDRAPSRLSLVTMRKTSTGKSLPGMLFLASNVTVSTRAGRALGMRSRVVTRRSFVIPAVGPVQVDVGVFPCLKETQAETPVSPKSCF